MFLVMAMLRPSISKSNLPDACAACNVGGEGCRALGKLDGRGGR